MAQILNNTYEILEFIGKGGMSTVFKARHIRLNTIVAIKSVRKSQAIDLMAEVNILTKLNHPNLVRVSDIFEDEKLIYIVMDFVEGEDLQHIIRREKVIPEETVIEWYKTLAGVFAYLHSRKPPIIYRDMKPANVILQKDGTLKLIDFGIAREYKAQASGDTTYIGTNGFAAPEQFGQSQSDGRTDIYSLGITMYYLATGKSPLEPPYEYVPAGKLNPNISKKLELILEKSIKRNPEDRYQSAEELLSDLMREQAGCENVMPAAPGSDNFNETPAGIGTGTPEKNDTANTAEPDFLSGASVKKSKMPVIAAISAAALAVLAGIFLLMPKGSAPPVQPTDSGSSIAEAETSGSEISEPEETTDTNPEETEASSEADSKSITAEKVTLTVWAPSEDQSEENGNWLGKELEAFQAAHPEWEIEFKTGTCSEGDALTNIQTDPEAAADVFMFANDQIPGLLDTGALARLGGAALDQINSQNSQTTVNTVSYNGGVYGVPFTGNTWFMYYDKRVFSEDDVKNLDTMLEKGKVGFPLSNSWYIASFYVANGCTLFGENGDDAEAGFDFSGDKAVAVTNYLVDLVANPNFVDANGLTADALGQGTINCLFSGTWDYQSVVDTLGFENVGICAAPAYTLDGEAKQLKAFAGSKAIGVNPNSKNPEVAVALAAFLGSTQAQQDHYDLRNIIPTDLSISVDDPLANAQMDAMDFASIVQPLQANMGQYWSPAENMGKELVAKTVTHDNAADKTEAMNETMNTAAVQ